MNKLGRYNQSYQEHLIIESCSLPDYRKEVLEQYSPEYIHSTLAEMNSQTYSFGTHTMKLADPILSQLNCNVCGNNTFAKNKAIVLLFCRHVAHVGCSHTGGCVALPHCYQCKNSGTFMQKYRDASEFLDNVELSCVNDDCSFTLLKHSLDQPINDRANALLNQAVREEFQKLGPRIVVNFAKKLNRLQMLPERVSDFQPFERAITREINALPTIKPGTVPVNLYMDIDDGDCPVPISSFINEPAKGFLHRHQQYLVDFIINALRKKPYCSNDAESCASCISYKNDESITVNCSNFTNICSKQLSYQDQVIETGSTGADAFRKFKKLLCTDLAILDLWYSPSTHIFYEQNREKPYLCKDWDAVADTITIKKGDYEAELKPSNFIDYAKKTINWSDFEQEVNNSGFSYQALIHYA